MHYHLEIVMPPTDDVNKAIETILAPFDENGEDSRHAFWDWYEIGGRWSGAKQEARLPKDAVEKFKAWLTESSITVSGLQFGKQELSPVSQIALVDMMWTEMTGAAGPCPLFSHSNTDDRVLPGDVCLLHEAPNITASHVIIAGPYYDGRIEAEYMIQQQIWNGVNHVDTTWNGTLSAALAMFKERCSSCRDEWVQTHTPQDNWLVVTVDYHS
jgi:hypothetical protein